MLAGVKCPAKPKITGNGCCGKAKLSQFYQEKPYLVSGCCIVEEND
jgi:hypothetical protein